jgi:putative phosphoesterase
MKICVCSDTHGDSSGIAEMAAKERPEAILFLGDGLRDLERVTLPPATAVFAVRGNCDFASSAPEERLATLGGVGFYLTHGHLQDVKQGLAGLRRAAPPEAAVVCYGHTHRADVRAEDGRIYLCPGSLGRGSYAVVETAPQLRYGMRML